MSVEVVLVIATMGADVAGVGFLPGVGQKMSLHVTDLRTAVGTHRTVLEFDGRRVSSGTAECFIRPSRGHGGASGVVGQESFMRTEELLTTQHLAGVKCSRGPLEFRALRMTNDRVRFIHRIRFLGRSNVSDTVTMQVKYHKN